jgi:hypothetical protein
MLSRENRWPRAEGGAESDSRRHGDEAAPAVTHERGEEPSRGFRKESHEPAGEDGSKDLGRSIVKEKVWCCQRRGGVGFDESLAAATVICLRGQWAAASPCHSMS